jgi:hypothetical protein
VCFLIYLRGLGSGGGRDGVCLQRIEEDWCLKDQPSPPWKTLSENHPAKLMSSHKCTEAASTLSWQERGDGEGMTSVLSTYMQHQSEALAAGDSSWPVAQRVHRLSA